MNHVTKHIIFAGRVQGVGFRFTASRVAARYALTGFVRNLPDGTVEMVLQGQEADVNGCIAGIKEAFGGYISTTTLEQHAHARRYESFQITG
jgi:acylphosphatase